MSHVRCSIIESNRHNAMDRSMSTYGHVTMMMTSPSGVNDTSVNRRRQRDVVVVVVVVRRVTRSCLLFSSCSTCDSDDGELRRDHDVARRYRVVHRIEQETHLRDSRQTKIDVVSSREQMAPSCHSPVDYVDVTIRRVDLLPIVVHHA
jgi:hypothetical protein